MMSSLHYVFDKVGFVGIAKISMSEMIPDRARCDVFGKIQYGVAVVMMMKRLELR